MFHGQPYCEVCTYEGPNFMWSYHHYAGLAVLLCNRKTHELRTVYIEDRPEFFDHTKTESELDAVFENVIAETVANQLREDEFRVNVIPFALSEDSATTLQCPSCAEMLHWRPTGIS